MSKIGMIAACDLNGLIGYDNKLPWRNKTDLKRFRNITENCTLIMGRKTYESIPVSKKHHTKLPNRIKHVLSTQPQLETDDTKWFSSIKAAIEQASNNKDIWICGGASIYKEAIRLGVPDFIDLTILNFIIVPKNKEEEIKSAYLPHIGYKYSVDFEVQNQQDPCLWHRVYKRRPGSFNGSLFTCTE